MARRVNLRIKNFKHYVSPDKFPFSLITATLYCLSEYEALVLRPGQYNFFRRSYLKAKGVRIAKNCFMGNGFRLYKTQNYNLSIGENGCFGENAIICVHDNILIGRNFVAAPGLTINNGVHDLETMKPSARPINIGERVWCAVNVTIAEGASIGDDCVIGANSLVISAIPPGSLAYGVPARVVRMIDRKQERNRMWSAFT